MQLAQRLDHAQDLVVGLALWQRQGQAQVQCLGLEKQLAHGIGVARRAQGGALAQIGPLRRGQGVQRTAGLARIAGDFGHAFLVTVELFQHDHRQKDIVLLKAEQTHRVVHQHIGVEHKEFAGAAGPAFGPGRAGHAGRGGSRADHHRWLVARVGGSRCAFTASWSAFGF